VGPDKDYNESGARIWAPAMISHTLAWIVLKIPEPKIINCANMTEFLNGF